MMALSIVSAACFAVALFGVYLMIRNEWVYRQRMKFHAEAFERPAQQWRALGCPKTDDLAASHNEMMVRFWVWDSEKFRKRRLPPPGEAA
jgi:hypothetical protein